MAVLLPCTRPKVEASKAAILDFTGKIIVFYTYTYILKNTNKI